MQVCLKKKSGSKKTVHRKRFLYAGAHRYIFFTSKKYKRLGRAGRVFEAKRRSFPPLTEKETMMEQSTPVLFRVIWLADVLIALLGYREFIGGVFGRSADAVVYAERRVCGEVNP